MGRTIVAIDQGTTSSRGVLFDETGDILRIEQTSFAQHYPEDGWVEHDPEEIWNSVKRTLKGLFQQSPFDPKEVAAIGITNQRETTVIWDRKTGAPIYPAIVWQDRRTAATCEALREEGLESQVTLKTGLLLDPYFSATKISWILDHVDGARRRAENGELAFGTIDTFLLWRLTEGRVHRTDATNASRTLLFNIHDQAWDEALLAAFRVPSGLLPTVRDCVADFGETTLLGPPIPITAMVGDQQGALVGQCCFEKGTAKITYGTGGFLMVNTGQDVVSSQNRLLSTVGYRLGNTPVYAMEGSIFVAGAAIKWLGENLRFFDHPEETEALAAAADKSSRVVVVPAFTGLGAPHWDPDARGAIFGLTRDTGIPELVAATLESIAFQTADLLLAMEMDGAPIVALKVDGGMAANDGFLATLANITQRPVVRHAVIETTVLGAAYLAGLGAGLFDALESLKDRQQIQSRIEPDGDREKWRAKSACWKKSIESVPHH